MHIRGITDLSKDNLLIISILFKKLPFVKFKPKFKKACKSKAML